MSQKLYDTGKNIVNELCDTKEQNKPKNSHDMFPVLI